MHKDLDGNTIRVKKGVVKITLKKETRIIGTIDDENKVLNVKRKRFKHILRVNNSYGFNYYILSNAKRFDKIKLNDEYGVYVIPIEKILAHGTYLHFQKQNFEKQIFLHINYLNSYKVN